MTDYPDVGVMLFTYKRYETAQRTLRALAANLHYSGRLRLHVSDDGSPGDFDGFEQAEALRRLAVDLGFDGSTATNSGQRGYGASYNRATQALHGTCPVLLPIEDDWELTEPLNIDLLVETLVAPGSRVRCIRMGYVGYTQELRGAFISTPAGQMLLLDPTSPERHVLAGHPRLETREFERAVGPWPEGRPAGETEFIVCGWPAAREGVAWPLDVLRPSEHCFAHIGTEEYGEHVPGSA